MALDLACRIVVARTRGGRLIVPVPVDLAAWTEQGRKFAGPSDLRVRPQALLVTGTETQRAIVSQAVV